MPVTRQDDLTKKTYSYLSRLKAGPKTEINAPPPIELNPPDWWPSGFNIFGAIDFIGRQEDLTALDSYLNEAIEKQTKIIQIHAHGGIGKTNLVTRWIHARQQALSRAKDDMPSHISLSRDLLEKFFSKESILPYSLYSQGTNKLSSSNKAAMEKGIWTQALHWFTGKKYKKTRDEFEKCTRERKTSDQKAEILIKELVKRDHHTLLILDGLEAALTLTENRDGESEWTTHDEFLKYFLKYILEDKSNRLILVITSRVRMTIPFLEYDDSIINHELKPLAFEIKDSEKEEIDQEDKRSTDEAAAVIYHYYKGQKSKAAKILVKASEQDRDLEEEETDIVRNELLREVVLEVPKNNEVLLKNLHNVANVLQGHALSLKLAGQLVAKGIHEYSWDYIAQNFDPKRHQSELSRFENDDEFRKTVRRVNHLIEPHLLILRKQNDKESKHILKALLAIGVFDRQANFQEIEYAAKYLVNLKGCPLKVSTSEELKNALKKLRSDRFLTYAQKLDAWDCHPLIRAYLCSYIFTKDDRKARQCHHQVAHFYIEKLSKKWKESVQIFLEKLKHVSQEDYMAGDSENEIQKKKGKEKRDKRKTKWINWKNENSEQADKDMELLQRAVYHFILAKELRNAWQLYWEWVSIRKEYLLSRFLGLFEDDLSTLSYFFESPWSSIKETPEENQKLSPDDIASLFDAVGFRLRSFNRLTEAHQASGGAFLEWHKAGWHSHLKISGKKNSRVLRETSYAAGNRAEYSMTQASLADALMHANLAIRLADESGSPRARFIHRVELAEILWHRGDTKQAIKLLEWINSESNIQFPEEDSESDGNSIPPRQWAEFYCLYRYRYGKILVSQGELKEAQNMAKHLDDDLKRTAWPLNRGLWHLLNGYIQLAQARPEWIVFPQELDNVPSDVDCYQCFEEGRENFETAQQEFEKIRAGHHVLKARLGAILCQYGDDGDSDAAINGRDDLNNGFENISNIAGERHLFRIDTEVMKAIVRKDASIESIEDDDLKKIAATQVDRARNMCIASGYLRHLPLLDSLSPKKE